MKQLKLFVILMTALLAVSCSDNIDTPLIDDGENDAQEVVDRPETDVIETYLDGDIAIVGNHFDEATAYILARVQGQKYNVSITDSALPESVRYLLLDDETVQGITSDDINRFIVPAYRQGVTICMHKPSNWKASGVLMALWEVEWGTDGKNESTDTPQRTATRAVDDGVNDTESNYDFWAMKPGGKTFNMYDIYDPMDTYDVTEYRTAINENGDTIVSDTIITYPIEEPTPYQYGLFAEQAVRWLNEREIDVIARSMRTTNDGSYDDMQTVVVNTSSSHTHYYYTGIFRQNKHEYTRNFSAPLTIVVYTSMMYNFEKDEDYYSVMVEEQYDASKIYDGLYFSRDGNYWNTFDSYAIGLSRLDMQIRTSWGEADYAPRLQYDIQPIGTASPSLSTEIEGWQLSADVSIGMEGVTGKPMAKVSSEKKVTEVQNDVTLTNQRDNSATGWTSWKYDFGHQPSISYNINTTKTEPPTNATCRTFSIQNQAWKWLVPNTKRRGDTPFTLKLNIASMKRRVAYLTQPSKSSCGVCDAQMNLEKKDFTFNLPVPQRYKHVYSLTTDEIGDLTEFNNLMTALRSVSTNFNSLYNKLIRLDSNGDPLGRTGVTELALTRMVGQEWYALAKEVQGKKIAVNKTYKFYVKDENGSKLSMINLTKGWKWFHDDYYDDDYMEYVTIYKDMGTYLVIGPDGITIE